MSATAATGTTMTSIAAAVASAALKQDIAAAAAGGGRRASIAGSARHSGKHKRAKSRRHRRASVGATSRSAAPKLMWGAGQDLPIYLRKYEGGIDGMRGAAKPGAAGNSARRRSSVVGASGGAAAGAGKQLVQHTGKPANGFPFPSAPALVPASGNTTDTPSKTTPVPATRKSTHRRRRSSIIAAVPPPPPPSAVDKAAPEEAMPAQTQQQNRRLSVLQQQAMRAGATSTTAAAPPPPRAPRAPPATPSTCDLDSDSEASAQVSGRDSLKTTGVPVPTFKDDQAAHMTSPHSGDALGEEDDDASEYTSDAQSDDPVAAVAVAAVDGDGLRLRSTDNDNDNDNDDDNDDDDRASSSGGTSVSDVDIIVDRAAQRALQSRLSPSSSMHSAKTSTADASTARLQEMAALFTSIHPSLPAPDTWSAVQNGVSAALQVAAACQCDDMKAVIAERDALRSSAAEMKESLAEMEESVREAAKMQLDMDDSSKALRKEVAQLTAAHLIAVREAEALQDAADHKEVRGCVAPCVCVCLSLSRFSQCVDPRACFNNPRPHN